MNAANVVWNIDHPDSMIITIRDGSTNKSLLTISIAEVIESSSRARILQHIKECDNTQWLTRWQNEKHEAIVTLLKADISTE